MPHIRNSVPEEEETARPYRSWDKYDEPDPAEDFDLASAFKDLIQRDPTVCDNCFQKNYTRVTHEWWRGTFGWLDYERWVPFPEHVEDIPADEGRGTRLTCGNCGHRSTKHRPVPKDRVQEFAENISQTLKQKQVEHDSHVLKREVDRRNNSSNQGKQDSHVFAPAVRSAIENHQL